MLCTSQAFHAPDRGVKFCSAQLTKWLQNKGIHHCLVNMATPSENGLIERKNQQIQTISHCLLRDSGLSKKYWAESFRTAVHLMNRLWNSAIDTTPFQKMHNRRPCLKFLCLFGCKAWSHVPAKLGGKGQDRMKKMIFLGYESGTKAYRFDDSNCKLIRSRGASFAEQHWDRVNESVGLPRGRLPYLGALVHRSPSLAWRTPSRLPAQPPQRSRTGTRLPRRPRQGAAHPGQGGGGCGQGLGRERSPGPAAAGTGQPRGGKWVRIW